jgi:hypothetical protein
MGVELRRNSETVSRILLEANYQGCGWAPPFGETTPASARMLINSAGWESLEICTELCVIHSVLVRRSQFLRSFIGFRRLLFCSPPRSARVLPDSLPTHALCFRWHQRDITAFGAGVPLSIPWRRKTRRQIRAP